MRKNRTEIEWRGPFGWPKFEGDLPSILERPGVYLETVEYQNGYLIYAAGITGRSISIRFKEHTRKYMSGFYNVLAIAAMKKGVRRKVWQGFWTETPPKDRLTEYKKRQLKIQEAARKQLAGFRIFVAIIGNRKRVRERIEAAIMNNLYDKQPKPFCDVPDRNMRLIKRRPSEKPIVVKNNCESKLYGLPAYLEI
jgi:hypothetical protein